VNCLPSSESAEFANYVTPLGAASADHRLSWAIQLPPAAPPRTAPLRSSERAITAPALTLSKEAELATTDWTVLEAPAKAHERQPELGSDGPGAVATYTVLPPKRPPIPHAGLIGKTGHDKTVAALSKSRRLRKAASRKATPWSLPKRGMMQRRPQLGLLDSSCSAHLDPASTS
jgi:hypothetical protein